MLEIDTCDVVPPLGISSEGGVEMIDLLNMDGGKGLAP